MENTEIDKQVAPNHTFNMYRKPIENHIFLLIKKLVLSFNHYSSHSVSFIISTKCKKFLKDG